MKVDIHEKGHHHPAHKVPSGNAHIGNISLDSKTKAKKKKVNGSISKCKLKAYRLRHHDERGKLHVCFALFKHGYIFTLLPDFIG